MGELLCGKKMWENVGNLTQIKKLVFDDELDGCGDGGQTHCIVESQWRSVYCVPLHLIKLGDVYSSKIYPLANCNRGGSAVSTSSQLLCFRGGKGGGSQ